MTERQVLRELAKQYLELASQDVNEINRKHWSDVNSLKPGKPTITIDQIPWEEMNRGDELTLLCRDPFLRSLERQLRETIYRRRYFPCDMVVEKYLRIPKVFHTTGTGVETQLQKESPGQNAQTHLYEDQFPDIASLNKLHEETITYDREQSEADLCRAQEILGDILPCRLTGVVLWEALWDRIVFWRGAAAVLYDFADNGELLHRLMRRLVEIELNSIDQYEAQNLLEPYPQACHCAATYNEDIPGKGFDAAHVKASDCWVAGAAQIFSEVSPAMHEEFEFNYVNAIYRRFGLVNYGCCEPLDKKIDLVRKLDHVRLISVSPWANVDIAADAMGPDYVMARKPNPAFVANGGVDRDAVIEETRRTLRACARSHTNVHFILKDITTVQNHPERLTEWYQIVRNEIEKFC